MENAIQLHIEDEKIEQEPKTETTQTQTQEQPQPTTNNNNTKNINTDNLIVIIEWIKIAAYKIEYFSICMEYFQFLLLYNNIAALLLSAANGTIGVANYNYTYTQQYTQSTNIISILIIIFSFTITVSSGIIKSLQVQEKLETCIQIKQEWINFSVSIAAEIQLPPELRRPEDVIIQTFHMKYLDLLKNDMQISYLNNKLIGSKHMKKLKNINRQIASIKANIKMTEFIKLSNNEKNKKEFYLNLLNNINDVNQEIVKRETHDMPLSQILSNIAYERLEKDILTNLSIEFEKSKILDQSSSNIDLINLPRNKNSFMWTYINTNKKNNENNDKKNMWDSWKIWNTEENHDDNNSGIDSII